MSRTRAAGDAPFRRRSYCSPHRHPPRRTRPHRHCAALIAASANPYDVTTVQQIEQCLASLEPESIELSDDSASHAGHPGAKSGGGHYHLTVVSAHFSGKTALERHRMVYRALAPLMRRQIHALALRTFAPGEF
ncbi:MAG: BolA family transcriptional regulator [Burkholderiales bacterium]|nr:BolA family transcriptional regulator [Burkholderiales bacterium]